MKDLPVRKKNRLAGYDYNQNGAYFITFCVKDRHEMLGEVVGGGVLDAPSIKLSEIGETVEKQIVAMNNVYETIAVDKYVIMPNHVHIIVVLDIDNGSSGTPPPTNATIPAFVSALKRYTHKQVGLQFWQRGYHDRIIRDEDEYRRVWQYIDENLERWQEDEYFNA